MNVIDIAAVAFFVGNGVRILAYVPQIVALVRVRDGASGFSMLSWGMFGLAHATTAIYALFVQHDAGMAAIFAINFAFCGVIVWLGWVKRARHEGSRKDGPSEPGSDGAGPAISRPEPDSPRVVALDRVRRSRAA